LKRTENLTSYHMAGGERGGGRSNFLVIENQQNSTPVREYGLNKGGRLRHHCIRKRRAGEVLIKGPQRMGKGENPKIEEDQILQTNPMEHLPRRRIAALGRHGHEEKKKARGRKRKLEKGGAPYSIQNRACQTRGEKKAERGRKPRYRRVGGFPTTVFQSKQVTGCNKKEKGTSGREKEGGMMADTVPLNMPDD